MGPYSVAPPQLVGLTLPADPATSGSAVVLEADVYYPRGEGPFPVLLMRQPYGRAIASTVVYAHPRWYASHGYIVVIQDVRGRGTSTGEFDLFRHETEDGYATVLWAANLPGSNGMVGMYGFSYQGMTQLYAASQRPAPLKTIIPAMVGYHLYQDWAYENGALLLQLGLAWAIQLAADTARRHQDRSAYQRLYRAAHHLPLDSPTPACPPLLQELAPDSFFHDWLRHPQDDAYWESLRPDLSQVDLPMLHMGGWADPYLRGDLRLYHQMQGQSSQPQHLWIGPWSHLPWSRRVGLLDFGAAADSPVDRLQLQWFDHFLKGQSTDLIPASPVHLFEMGSNHWQAFNHWPSITPQPLYLSSTGLAATHQQDGQLTPTPPARQGQDTWVHDPWRPVPSLGGHSAIPAGYFERSALDGRSDVVTYTTCPLVTPLRVVGTIHLSLYCQVDAISFDLSVILSEVYPDGRVINLTQGYQKVDGAGQTEPLLRLLDLHPTCFLIPAHHRLRLSLAAACFPAYPVNSGTGQPLAMTETIDHQVITLELWHGGDYPSSLELPCR